MRYLGTPDFQHQAESCAGVLLVNLGTPQAPTTAALRPYLAEFLSDPRVIEVPALLWRPLLHAVILRLRPRRSAAAYRRIWTPDGSPLMVHSRRLTDSLAAQLSARLPGPVRVELAMRYGQPSVEAALQGLKKAGLQRLLVLPLYPQYSAATTASAFDAVSKVLRRWRRLPELRMVRNYHDHPAYVQAVAESIRRHTEQHGRPEKLLFSFHGLPRHYFLQGDPYHCECCKSARLIAQELGLPEQDWEVVFQSRFGPRPWLQPYLDRRLKQLAGQQVKHVQIVCPGFSVDCLETLEEVQIDNRKLFLQAGGAEFSYVPALNDSQAQVELLIRLILQHAAGWPEFSPDWNEQAERQERTARARRAAQAAANTPLARA